MNIAELKFVLGRGPVNDQMKSMVRKYISEGIFTKQQLIDEGISKEKLDELLRVSREEHLKNLENDSYSVSEVREFLQSGALTKEDLTAFHKRNIRRKKYEYAVIEDIIRKGEVDEFNLVNEGLLSQEELDDIFNRDLPLLNIGFDSWDQVPPLLPNRVDVFVLGIVGSGKSAFMAGLLSYARHVKGSLTMDRENKSGAAYVDAITDAVKRGILPPRTPDEKMQYMACSFRSADDESKQIPMTFIEMSGEVFQKCYARGIDQMPPKFVEYITHENNKVLVLAVDFKVHTAVNHSLVSQQSHFESIIAELDAQGTFRYTKAICLLITKWDMSPDPSEEAAIRFLQEEYLNLFNMCRDMERKYKLKFTVYRYSLGKFERRNSYKYDPKDSSLLYNWLCSFMPVQQLRQGGGLFGKLFGKK